MKSILYPMRGLLMLCIILHLKPANAQQFLTKIDGWNAYVHLPDEYNDSLHKTYPLICFIPGLGEIGTSASKLLTYGPAKFIAQGHNMQFMVNGKLEKPIVISMQPVSGWPNAWTINVKVDSILKRWRIDPTRVNGTGLSMGGWSWNNYVDGYNPVYTNKITSIVSMSAPEPDNTISNMRHFALAGGKWWGFEGNQDLRKGDWIRDTLNKYVPASARYTLYSGTHCCWNSFYDPNYMENGESIYTWMLKQRKVAPVLPVPNSNPQANAGRDSIIPVPINSITLKGAGNDPDGNPIQFTWKKLEGPTGTISNVTNPQTNVIALTTGTYRFELEVTDALGAKGKDTVTINNGNLVLPVVLVNLVAYDRNGATELRWATAQELNSSHFDVEWSSNGTEFSSIGNVFASGTSQSMRHYQYTDNEARRGVSYYRLKMVDIDGSFTYSRVVSVQRENEFADIELVNTSFRNSDLTVKLLAVDRSSVNIILTDASGKVIMRSVQELNSGANEIRRIVPVQRGAYYLTIMSNSGKVTRTVLHQ